MVGTTDDKVSVQPGNTYQVFSVPSDKWLILTDIGQSSVTGGADFSVEESLNGTNATKLPAFALYGANGREMMHLSSSGLGIPFQPGSAIVVMSLYR